MATHGEDGNKRLQETPACPHCGATGIAKALKINQNAEVGRIGLPYQVAGIFTGTEALHADLCEGCGTVLRLYVLKPKRKWISS